jgi:phosphatidylglycerophosphatase C
MNLALFDFDNTITTGDTYTPFIRRTAGGARLLAGTVLLAPLLVAYRLGFLPATRLRAAMTWVCYRGRSERAVHAAGVRYAAGLSACVREEARARLDFHRERGDHVVVVSASLDAYLGPWCEAQGFDLICTELEGRGGVLTGRVRGGDCTGEEKARRVRARYRLDDYPVVYAYGDCAEDEALLALADKAYLRWHEQGGRDEDASATGERGLRSVGVGKE